MRNLSDIPSNYRLLDFGNGRKLEMFGEIILDRPAPQATKSPRFPHYWEQAHAYYERGGWKRRLSFNEPWHLRMNGILFELRLSAGGQVGVFPEQVENWQWLRNAVSSARRDLAVLNAFAYTGGATLATITASTSHRFEVCHLDGARSAVAWARHNAALNGKKTAPVRWIVDDTLSFLRREVRREHRYDGIILDPPAFGRGPRGKPWKLSDDLPELLDVAATLLSERPLFFLFSWHDPSLSAEEVIKAVERRMEPVSAEKVFLTIPCEAGASLPAGTALRFLF